MKLNIWLDKHSSFKHPDVKNEMADLIYKRFGEDWPLFLETLPLTEIGNEAVFNLRNQ